MLRVGGVEKPRRVPHALLSLLTSTIIFTALTFFSLRLTSQRMVVLLNVDRGRKLKLISRQTSTLWATLIQCSSCLLNHGGKQDAPPTSVIPLTKSIPLWFFPTSLSPRSCTGATFGLGLSLSFLSTSLST